MSNDFSKQAVDLRVFGEAVIVAEIPFMAIMRREQDRDRLATGPLRQPPQLFVVCYSLMNDATTVRPVEWEVAETLAPAAFGRFCERLRDARARMAAEADAKKSVTD